MLKIIGGEYLDPPKTLPTPSVSLNRTLGGGIWTDRISTLWGNSMSGKTTFALHLMADAQKENFVPVIVDGEGSYTDAWAERCGIDLSQRILLRTSVVEDITKELLPLMRKREQKYIFLIDSISGLIFEKFNKEDDGGKDIGSHAKPQKWLTIKLLGELHPNCAVIYISQLSTGFTQQGSYTKPNFGYAVEYYSSNIVKLYTSKAKDSIERDKSTERILGQKVTWTIDKCRQTGAEGTKGDYWYNKETAEIDRKAELVHIAKRVGIITGSTWLTYKGEKYQGVAKLMAALTPADYEMLENAIMSMDYLGGETEDESS